MGTKACGQPDPRCRDDLPAAQSHTRGAWEWRGPRRLCLFLDNSDQLQPNLVGDLYDWSNSISGDAGAMLWLFLRPETFSILQMHHQRAPISLRGPEPIHAPTLKEVVLKRIDTFSEVFKHSEHIKIPFRPGVFLPGDVQSAVAYLTSLSTR